MCPSTNTLAYEWQKLALERFSFNGSFVSQRLYVEICALSVSFVPGRLAGNLLSGVTCFDDACPNGDEGCLFATPYLGKCNIYYEYIHILGGCSKCETLSRIYSPIPLVDQRSLEDCLYSVYGHLLSEFLLWLLNLYADIFIWINYPREIETFQSIITLANDPIESGLAPSERTQVYSKVTSTR